MDTKHLKKTVIMLSLVTAAAAAQASPKPAGTFAVEVKATAPEQYAYATRITPDAADRTLRDVAVIRSVEALSVIPRRWPGERAWGIRAYREMMTRLAGARLYDNAISVCDTAIAYAGKTPDALVFVAAKGRSLMWLGRMDEARDAFNRATSGEFNRLGDFDQNSILLDAMIFHEQEKNFVAAAKDARARAKIAKSDLSRAEALRKALELSMRANDRAAAKGDLAALSDAALNARMRTLSPEESQVLRRIDTEIAQYGRRLGM
jgi:tetratricopeptide (TPR) repeat protein